MSISKIVLSAVVAAGLMLGSVNAFAMHHDGEMDAHKMAMKMQKDLSLSKEQTDKVEGIFKDMHEEATKLRDEMKGLKDATDDKIRAELTPEQVKKFDENHKKHMEKRQEMMNKKQS
ncbi:MAG: Spy/CpxP family protein refolding chaperone [Gammaproteobacteria bacterium]